GRRGGADQPDAEVPLVAVVEQEQELLAGGDVTDAQPVSCPFRPPIVRRRRAGVLGRVVPGLAAEEERPQMRVVEAEGERDGLAQVAERVFAGELELTPDLPAIGWGVYAAEDAYAERVGSRGDRRSGGGHLQHSEATSGWESTLSPTAGHRRPPQTLGWRPDGGYRFPGAVGLDRR